jgi:hypothetical protein
MGWVGLVAEDDERVSVDGSGVACGAEVRLPGKRADAVAEVVVVRRMVLGDTCRLLTEHQLGDLPVTDRVGNGTFPQA